jgi:hypothetical protein
VGSSAARMVARKARQSRRLEPVQGSGSRPESTRGVCGGSPQNRRVTWLSHKIKTGGSVGRDGIRACREASMSADTWRDRKACVGRTRTAAKVWSCDEEECYMTYIPLRGLYHNLSARSSLVICPTQRDYFSFPCSIGVDFLHHFVENLSSNFVENLSSECMEAFMVALISFL